MLNSNLQFLKEIEKDLPINSKPFSHSAKELNITEEELLTKIKESKEQGLIRRYGAILGHRKTGFSFNVMAVFDIPENKLDEIGEQFAEKKYITHCYQRDRYDAWPFNFYAMVHAVSEEQRDSYLQELKEIAGDYPFRALKSGKEYKKTSLQILK